MPAMNFGWTKVQYVLVYAVVGAYLPYLPLLLGDRGVDEKGIGWILGIYGLVIAIMPLWTTYLADRHWSPRLLIAAGNLLTAAGALALIRAEGFWPLMAGCVIMYAGFAPLVNLIDGATFAAMARMERAGLQPPPYHTIRIWGSIGFMLPSVAIYALLQWGRMSNAIALWTAAVCAVLAALASRRLPGPDDTHQLELIEAPTLAAARRVFSGSALSVIGPLFLMFVTVAAFYTFYPQYLRKLGIGEQWVGLIVNLGVVAEIILMLASRRILGRLGIRGIVLMGGAAIMLRMGLLGFWPNPHVAIWSQLLHAPIVMCLYLLPPIYLNHIAGGGGGGGGATHIRHSVQGLYGMLCFGAARLVGATLSGYFATEADLTPPFKLSAALALAAILWFAIGFRDESACRAIRHAHRRPEPTTTTPVAEP